MTCPPHRIDIESPHGERTVHGKCRYCGFERDYYVDPDAEYNTYNSSLAPAQKKRAKLKMKFEQGVQV